MTHTDFGCRELDEAFGVRVFGSEYTFTREELAEFITHLRNVLEDGHEESFGEGYHDCCIANARRGSAEPALDMLAVLGLTQPREPLRRL